jgi:hypothetical protein
MEKSKISNLLYRDAHGDRFFFAKWQSGLATLSGFSQRKLRLELARILYLRDNIESPQAGFLSK